MRDQQREETGCGTEMMEADRVTEPIERDSTETDEVGLMEAGQRLRRNGTMTCTRRRTRVLLEPTRKSRLQRSKLCCLLLKAAYCYVSWCGFASKLVNVLVFCKCRR